MKKRQYGTYTKDPVTGNKKRPILTLEQMNKRFDLIYGAVKASEANGTPMRHRWLMPGLARWAMKLERGCADDHGILRIRGGGGIHHPRSGTDRADPMVGSENGGRR